MFADRKIIRGESPFNFHSSWIILLHCERRVHLNMKRFRIVA